MWYPESTGQLNSCAYRSWGVGGSPSQVTDLGRGKNYLPKSVTVRDCGSRNPTRLLKTNAKAFVSTLVVAENK